MTDTLAPPPHSFEIKVNGEIHTVFMSFALLNRICYIMGDNSQIPLILQDAQLREAVMEECFAIRSQTGKMQAKRTVDEIDFDMTEALNMLEWVTEHVTNFTVAAVGRAHKVMTRNQTKMDAVGGTKESSSTSTPTGSESSLSKSPAA